MKKIMKNLIAVFVALSVAACSDDTIDVLNEDNYVGVNSELYSGLWGIASAVADVADQAPIVEGLRGGMLEPTENATSEMMALYNYERLDSCSLADPMGYYRIIREVNDYVKHVADYRAKNPTAIVFEEKYGVSFELYISTAVRYKVWAYLMLAKMYGGAYYFNDPEIEYENDTDIPSYDWLNFNQVIDSCIALIEEPRTYDVKGDTTTRWATFLFPSMTGENASIQQYDRYQFTPWTLLTELYLWKAAKGEPGYYRKAYDQATEEIRRSGFVSGGECYILSFRTPYYSDWQKVFYSFARWEDITMATYTPRQGEYNRLDDYASNIAPYHYYVRPTEVGMLRFDSTSVVNSESSTRGDKYRGRGKSFKEVNGQMVFSKWISSIDRLTNTEVSLPLYRAGHLYLMLCEAIVGMAKESGDPELQNAYIESALVLLNQGISTYWDAAKGEYDAKQCISKLPNFPTNLYRTNSHTASASTNTNRGLRGRVYMSNVGTDIVPKDNDGNYVNSYPLDEKVWKVDSLLCEEAFFELSGEGHVMPIFYRMMQRHGNDPAHKDFLTKFIAAGRSDIEAKLQTDENWFLDYNIK